ncbi:MAG TPA: hypothetical protein VHB50_13635 [Bryobacteraceae bacterium]|nr:hypothetical protein [Bryobacteraceae bacterium]
MPFKRPNGCSQRLCSVEFAEFAEVVFRQNPLDIEHGFFQSLVVPRVEATRLKTKPSFERIY